MDSSPIPVESGGIWSFQQESVGNGKVLIDRLQFLGLLVQLFHPFGDGKL